MPLLDEQLREELERLSNDGLLRRLRRIDMLTSHKLHVHGHGRLDFSSNDYLGLSRHPRVIEAAQRATKDWGASSRGSRLICGSLAVHHELEELLAAWKDQEAALLFSSGYAAASGVIPALASADDLILADRLIHACCLDGIRLSRGQFRVFQHNDMEHLENLLIRARRTRNHRKSFRRIWIVAESVYSMDGDVAPIRRLVALKEKYGAYLLLDEAHATGLYGNRRTGLAEAMGVSSQIDVHLGTLGKGIGSSGGYICGSRILIDYLINRSRSLIFSTAPPPGASAAAAAAVGLINGEEGRVRCQVTWENARRLNQGFAGNQNNLKTVQSAILLWHVGESQAALELSSRLLDQGIFVPPIRYPTVPKGEARLRFTVSAEHTHAQIDQVAESVRKCSALAPQGAF